MNNSALRIYQELVDRASDALLAGDFEICLAALALPFRIVTNGGEILYQKREDVLDAMKASHNSMRERGVTHNIRLVTSARYETPSLITGRHETHTVRGSEHDIPPYPSSMTMVLEDGVWRITQALHGLENTEFPISVPKVRDDPQLPSEENSAQAGSAGAKTG